MATPRLTSRFWVDAYLARLRLMDIPAFVTAHGDDTAGVVWVVLNTLDGNARLFARRYDFMADETRWEDCLSGPEQDITARLASEKTSDPDLWVIEVEDRQGRHLLDEM
ncbi:DUF1491 family protein [Primorskyibacter sp. S187A]|uniref:DUF1491 family protein n=1 Tax=Primorskyibacter sp. S187A TaxID=3415130 RepID=UPI003C7D6258